MNGNIATAVLTAAPAIRPPDLRHRHIRALTGLRGLAAFDVAISHINGGTQPVLNWIAFHNPSVDIFFCLSSFTLCLVYGPGTGQPFPVMKFAVARLARVYPLYLLVLALSAAYSAAWGLNAFSAYSPAEGAVDGLRQLLAINAWPVIGSGVHWVAPMWSLSIEVFCYVLLFPLLYYATALATVVSARVLVLAIVVLGAVTFGVYTLFYVPEINVHSVPAPTGALIHWVAVIRGGCMFTAGWLAYIIYRHHKPVWQAIASKADLIAGAMLLIIIAQALHMIDVELLVVLAPLLLLGLVQPGAVVEKVLSTQPLYWLGLMSYSIYMLHWPIMMAVWRYLPDIHRQDALRIPLTLGLTLIAAYISFHGFERPTRAAVRRLGAVSQHQPATDVPA